MHIKLKNDKMLNLNCVNNVRQGFKSKNTVIIELTNGLTILEGTYPSDAEAEAKVTELKSKMLK